MRKHWGMRVVSALLIAVMLCSEIQIGVFASENTQEDPQILSSNVIEEESIYEIYEDDLDNRGLIDEMGETEIPEEYENMNDLLGGETQYYRPYENATYELSYRTGFYYYGGEGSYKDYGISGYRGTDSGELIIPKSIDGNLIKIIGADAFNGARGFAGGVVIPDSIKIIGNHAFRNCWGLCGDLTIPNSVERLGEGAFAHCSGLNGNLYIPGSVKEIGKNAFWDCSFSGNLKIENGVTSIGSMAFYNCRFSGDLTIPNSVTEIGERAFYSLNEISGKLTLPNQLKTIESSAFSSCGCTGSLVIPYTVKSIKTCAFLDCNNLEDVYISANVNSIEDGAFGNIYERPIIPATFHCVPGSYAYQRLTEIGATVVAWEGDSGLFSGPQKTCVLRIMDIDTKNPIPDAAVSYSKSGLCFDGKTDKDGYITLNVPGDININARISHKKYQTRWVTIGEKSKPTETFYLSRSTPIKVKMPSMKKDLEIKQSIKVMGQNIDWIKMRYKLELGNGNTTLPITYEYDQEKQQYKIVIGTQTKGDFDTLLYETKELCNSNLIKTNADRFQKKVDKYRKKYNCEETTGKFGTDVKFHSFGFVVLDNDMKLIESGAIIGFSGKGEITWRDGLVYAKASLTLSADGKLFLSVNEKGIDFNGEIELKQELGIGIGIGGNNIHLEGGAKGGFKEKLSFSSTSPLALEIYLYAKLYIEGKFFGCKKTYEEDFPNWKIFPTSKTGQGNSYMAAESYDLLEEMLSDGFEQQDREYTFYDSIPNPELSQEDVYPEGEPCMVTLNNGTKIVAWLIDDGTKSDANRTTLVYSYDDGNGWCTPRKVQETGRADFYPHMYSDGETAYLIWTNIREELTSGDSLEEYLDKTDLWSAEFNGERFTGIDQVTNSSDTKAKLNARIIGNGQRKTALWIENSENDPFLTKGTNAICVSEYNNGTWSDKRYLIDNLNVISSLTADYVGDELRLAYIMDVDGKMTTYTDTEVFLWSGGASIRLSDDEKNDNSVQFVNGSLYWSSGGDIVCMNNDTIENLSPELTGIDSFILLNNGSDRAVVFPVSDGLKNELFVSKEKEGVFETPYPLTSIGKRLNQYSVVYNSDDSISGMLFETEVDETKETDYFGKTDQHLYDELIASDIELVGLNSDDKELTEENILPISLEVYNGSSDPLTGVNVKVAEQGVTIDESALQCGILPGETGEITYNYDCGGELVNRDLTFTVTATGIEDPDLSNNSASIEIGLPDVALTDCRTELSGENTVIRGSIKNIGYKEATGTIINIKAGGEEGEVIYNQTIGAVAAGAENDIEFSIPEQYLDYESADDGKHFYLVLTCEEEESNAANNSDIVVAFPIRVTGINLDKEDLELSLNARSKVQATISPESAMDKSVYYVTNDAGVAKVDDNGFITATGVGTTIITAISADGGYEATCLISVAEGENTFSLTSDYLVLEQGTSEKLGVLDESGEAVEAEIVWESGNADIARVSEDGTVSAISAGTTEILAKVGDYYFQCTVIVNGIDLEEITIDQNDIELNEGESQELSVSFYPENDSIDKTIQWSTSDESILSVSQTGEITAISGGEAKVIAKSENGIEAECYVQVIPTPRYSLEFDFETGAPNYEMEGVIEGSSVVLPAIPARDGYEFIGWFTEKDGEGYQFTDRTPVYENMKLYAKWNCLVIRKLNSIWYDGVTDQIYSGKAITPEILVYDGTTKLKEKDDYTVKYINNTNAGTAYVKITGKGNYNQEDFLKFKILPKSIGTGVALAEGITATIPDKQYKGSAQVSKPTIKFGKITLKEGKDYTLTYQGNQTGPGEVTVIATAKEGGNFTGSAQLTYTIFEKGKGLSMAYVAPIPNRIYTGGEINPDTLPIEVKESKASKTPLIRGTDYDVVYAPGTDPVNVGTVTALIRGKNAYCGTKAVTFKIVPATLTKDMITAENAVYTGAATTPAVTVTFGGEVVDPSNYTVTYKNNTKVETATAGKKAPTVVVKGKGNFAGSAESNFTIGQLALSEDDLKIAVTDIKDNGKEIDNKAIKATVQYENPVTGKTVTLKNGTDYDVSYQRVPAKQMQTVDISLKGNYQNDGDIHAAFRIFKAPTVLNENDFDVTISGNTTYNGTKIMPTVKITTTIEGNEIELVSGKDYTLTYSNNTNASGNPNKMASWKATGKGAYKGTLTGTFAIQPKALTNEGFAVSVADVKFNQKDQKPKLSVVDLATEKALKASDFTAVYDSTKGGTKEDAKVTITGKGNYNGTLIGHFRVYGTDISSATIEKIGNENYTGKAILPAGEKVKIYADKQKKILLQEGVHYTLSYGSNVKAGSGSVIITGIGEYGGSKTVKFTIVPKWLRWLL